MSAGESKHQSDIGIHLRKSFSDGDNRYDARFHFARHQYIYGDRSAGRSEFSKLGKLPLSPRQLNKITAYIVGEDGNAVRYVGRVVAKKDGFCFVRCQGLDEDVFVHGAQYERSAWEALHVGSSTKLFVGFNFKGVSGVLAPPEAIVDATPVALGANSINHSSAAPT